MVPRINSNRLFWSECRQLRPLLRRAIWWQLSLHPQQPQPVEPVCFRCGRKMHFAIRVDGKPESRCDWHLSDRLPFGVRKSAFAHVRRERQAS